jgi:hypothetical protein
LNPTVSVIVRNGTAAAAVRAERLATEENALAGDPFVSPRVTGRELRYERRANLLKQAGSIDEVITRALHFIPTARGLLPNRSISRRVFVTPEPSRLQSHSVAK